MTSLHLNSLSALAKQIIDTNPDAYGRLVAADATPSATQSLLGRVTPGQLFAAPIKSTGYASAALAGLWLWHDGLDESHGIVQKSPEEAGASSRQLQEMTETFAYWHAIMHRLEGDFSNSKYWLARCGRHPVFAVIANALPQTIKGSDPELSRLSKDEWNPGELVDLAQELHNRPSDPRHAAAVAIQRLEWNCLFGYCVQFAATVRG
jgi:hypothetical protein